MEFVNDTLKQWNMDNLIPIFEEQGIDIDAFNVLTESTIKELIPRIGDRVKFLNNFRLYRNSNESLILPLLDISNISGLLKEQDPGLSTPTSSTSSYSIVDIQENISPVDSAAENRDSLSKNSDNKKFDLESLLKSTAEGRHVLKLAGKFDYKIRNQLTDIIIKNELKLDETKNISTGRFLLLSKAVQDLFPTENLGTYFTPYQPGNETNLKRCARGKLYDKYNNVRRAFRSVDLIPKKRKFYDSSNESTESDNQEDCELVSWLEHCIEPWTDVCEKWDQTFLYRKKLLKTDIEPQDYFNTFPALKQPLGYSLIEADFKKKYKDYENKLFFNLPDLINSILLKARASLDQNIKKLLEENEPCENEEQKLAVGLIIFPYLFSKTQLISTKPKIKESHEGKKRVSESIHWRPSKAEVQQSFVVHLKSGTDIGPFLERRANKYAELKETCQPVIVLVGADLKKFQPFISFNNLKYSVGNLLKTVDVIFKFFHVLDLKYPVECDHVWFYMQKYIYGIVTPYDRFHLVVEQLNSDFSQMVEHVN